jgi:serine/threonine-protein kinase
MSPEQIRSAASVDARTDIWSLGVVLYELLTGRPPFTAATLPALCASVVSDTPTLPEHLPARVKSVVMRCLAKRREDRYSGLTELQEELAACLGAAGPAVSEPGTLDCTSAETRLQHLDASAPEELPEASSSPPRSGVVRSRARMISLVCGGVTAFAAAAVWGMDVVVPPESAKPALAVPMTDSESVEPLTRAAEHEPVVEPADAVVAAEQRPSSVNPTELPVRPKASARAYVRGGAKKLSSHRVQTTERARGDASVTDMEARYALTYQPEVSATQVPAGPALAAERSSERSDSEPALADSGM